MFGILNPWKPAAIAAGVALLVLGGYTLFLEARVSLALSGKRLAESQRQADKMQVRAITAGLRAAARTKEATDAKRISDAELLSAKLRGDVAEWVRRDADRIRRSAFGEGSATPKGTDRTGQVCLDRAAADAAIRDYRSGVRGLIAEGRQAVIDLQQCLSSWPTAEATAAPDRSSP